MAATARTATTLDHKTAVVIAASPGIAANATDGDTFPNGGNSILTMNNTGGSSYFVDVYPTGSFDGDLVITPRRHTVAAGVIKRVKLGPVASYGSTVLVKAENTAVKLLVEAV